jgi:hypothetical protein
MLSELRLRLVNAIKIIAFCTAGAVGYGVLNDQITSRICLEYFTIAHRKIEGLSDPSAIALYWGVVATWWVGTFLGTAVALAANIGRRPAYPFRSLLRPGLILLVVMFVCALISGIIGYALMTLHLVAPPGEMRYLIEQTKQPAFMADTFAHGASYIVGLIGGLILIGKTWHSRPTASEKKSVLTSILLAPAFAAAAFCTWIGLMSAFFLLSGINMRPY